MNPSPAALAAAEELCTLGVTTVTKIAAIIDRHMAPKPYVLENTLPEVCIQMRMRGGSFVRKLSDAMMAADPENLEIITVAFPAIMERYDSLAGSASHIEKDILNPL